MKITAALALCGAAAIALTDAHTINAKTRVFQTSQQFLDARDQLENLSGIKLPRMNGLRGEKEKAYIEKEGLLEVGDAEQMTDEMREKVFIEEFHKFLLDAEEKGIGEGISKAWGWIKDTWTDINFDFGWRFDAYTRAMSLINKVVADGWETPTAQSIAVPTEKTSHSKNDIDLINGVRVPEMDESWGDVTSISDYASSAIVTIASKPKDAANSGKWEPGENTGKKRWKAVEGELYGKWPTFRSLTSWNNEYKGDRYLDDSDSNEIIKKLVFYGIGQHRIRPVHPSDSQGRGATYCVKLDFAGGLPMRPGYAKLGADAYFDGDGNLMHMYRQGKYYDKNSGEGTRFRAKQCTTKREWHWPKCTWRGCSRGFWTTHNHCTSEVKEVIGWRQVKMAFRGTLHAVITAIDHLYVLHLVVANSIVTANVEELPPDHLVRRILTPFGFRSAAINYQASTALVNEWGLFQRAVGLTEDGIKALFDYAKTEQSDLQWVTIPQLKAKKGPGIASLNLPVDVDGGDYYDILFNFVNRAIRKKYTGSETGTFSNNDPCAADGDLQRWRNKVNSMTPLKDMPGVTCENLIDVMATFMYLVSGAHNHVGSVAAELEDPCFCPWAWRETEYPPCGTPRNFFTQAITMALTALKQPDITEDFTHLFNDETTKRLWIKATEQMHDLTKTIATRNQHRVRAFKAYDPSRIEVSVGI